ncbi:hypothetical protein GLW04_13030 [Halobacillus litoralis]|uniref:Uncharacterized protein n=1 Tax=Halobacillus litoralis TaxID=45668 RepID=A0A845DVJ5_9BACI|nr:hypothetical protein [Halobacillus litoralis]MYL20819.1 hypothetical protein [Halobacillus litoralis]
MDIEHFTGLCKNQDTEIDARIPPDSTYTIFDSTDGRTYSGLITLRNFNDLLTPASIEFSFGYSKMKKSVSLNPGQAVTIPFENTQTIDIINNDLETRADIEYTICTILSSYHGKYERTTALCTVADPDIDVDLSPGSEYTIFTSTTNKDYTGMISLDEVGSITTPDLSLTLTFLSHAGESRTFVVLNEQGITIPFTNIKEIRVRNNSSVSEYDFDYAICVFLPDPAAGKESLCSQDCPDIISFIPAATTASIFRGKKCESYSGMLSIESLDEPITIKFIPAKPSKDRLIFALEVGNSITIPFENVKEIQVTNDSAVDEISLQTQFCVFLEDNSTKSYR